jgi:hypothetical protein
MLRMLPALPMDSIEPALPMLSMEPALPMERIEPALPMLRTLPTLNMLPTLAKLKTLNKLFALDIPARLRLDRARPRMSASSLAFALSASSAQFSSARDVGSPVEPPPRVAHVVDLSAGRDTNRGSSEMADRNTRERKLVALMINDLGAGSEPDAARIEDEVRALSDEELDRTLAGRLDLPYPVDEEVLDRALARVDEPEELSGQGTGGFTGAPDMSHDPRPEEREV